MGEVRYIILIVLILEWFVCLRWDLENLCHFTLAYQSCQSDPQESINLQRKKATRGVLLKKVFLEISQNSQENTCARVYFLIKMQY